MFSVSLLAYILSGALFAPRLSMLKPIAYAGSALLAIMILIIIWGVVIEPRPIEQREWIAETPALPASWNRREIALIADLQVGTWSARQPVTLQII
jgi:hypothetical protein